MSQSRAKREALQIVLSFDNIELACFLDKFYREQLRSIRVVDDNEENDEQELGN